MQRENCRDLVNSKQRYLGDVDINMQLKKHRETSLDKYGYKLCKCGCGMPLANPSHPNWPKGWQNSIGPDAVPEGFSNGLHGPPGPPQITDTQVSLAKVIAVIDSEEELEGEMPEHIFVKASVSAEATALALRIACRATKENIKRRLYQLQVAADCNLDTDEGGEEARALHRVVRAMHDGHCPKCGYLAPADKFYQTAITNPQHPKGVRPNQHCCPKCGFTVTEEQAELALARFRPYLNKSVLLFEKWRSGLAVEEITDCDAAAQDPTKPAVRPFDN